MPKLNNVAKKKQYPHADYAEKGKNHGKKPTVAVIGSATMRMIM